MTAGCIIARECRSQPRGMLRQPLLIVSDTLSMRSLRPRREWRQARTARALRNGRSSTRGDRRLDLTLGLSQAGRRRRENPSHTATTHAGVLILHEGGRMAAIITPSDQSGDWPPPRRKLLAYSGRYRIENGRPVRHRRRHRLDAKLGWDADAAVTFSLRDGLLHIVSDPVPSSSSRARWQAESCRGRARDVNHPSRGHFGVVT